MHTLLLADDSITVQRVIALTFAEEPIHVVAVFDGRQAIETIAEKRPDIILAATTLSQVSGYELAHFVRSNVELHEVPVLLLSGAFETVDEAKLKTSGANGVIEKPVEPIAVIARVRELLGLRSTAKPAPVGRLVTSADPAKAIATTPRAVTSMKGTPSDWEQLRDRSGLDANTRSVENPSTRSDPHQNNLDVAFDSLDQQLSGRAPKDTPNPAEPLAVAGAATLSRAPGREPDSNPGNPVFEVDAEWFNAEESRDQADARAGRREMIEDLSAPELQMPSPVSGSAAAPIFDVDDEWFADAVEAPLEPASAAAATASVPASPGPRGIADDFAALLAHEQGEPLEMPVAEVPVAAPPIEAPAPQLTDAMLDQIAARVADRLTSGLLGEQLKSAMTDTVRETVRSIVSETSERLVRDEIDRIKSRTQT